MSYSLIILPAVSNDLTEALRERVDTGRALLAEIAAVLDKIRERPRRYPIAYAQVHRALTPRFHFAIFFEIVADLPWKELPSTRVSSRALRQAASAARAAAPIRALTVSVSRARMPAATYADPV
jgi:hypothetical protein